MILWKKNIIIILLVIIIIILIAFIVLFATGLIGIKDRCGQQNSDTNIKQDSESSIKSDQDLGTEQNNNIELNQKNYSAVLDEYKKAFLINNVDNADFKYVNEVAFQYYLSGAGFEFEYSFYDINKDGKDEMLVNNVVNNNGTIVQNYIVDIFSYDGTNVIKLMEDNSSCLAETRCSISLYDDGSIYLRGSNGASSSSIYFYSINKDISTLNKVNSYCLVYNDGSLSIYDESTYNFNNNTGTKLKYASEQELLSANISNANKIELNNLNWHKFN